MTLIAGTHLGRYEIRSKLGAGGMGEVYLALDEKLSRDVAIKVLPTSLSQNADRLHRLGRCRPAVPKKSYQSRVSVTSVRRQHAETCRRLS